MDCLALETKIKWIGEHPRDPKRRRQFVRWIEQKVGRLGDDRAWYPEQYALVPFEPSGAQVSGHFQLRLPVLR